MNSSKFKLTSTYKPTGDQPQAIKELVDGIHRGDKQQVLLGVTGSGKTFSMANVIAQINQPTIILAHNKTLAGQLYSEFKELFPENAVEYFVSYYDYYQPEAYLPKSDTHIDKEATINDDIERLRLSATRSLLEREDVIIVCSVSCIYGLGSPEAYYGMLVLLEEGKEADRDKVIRKLVEIHYKRNDIDFHRGIFRVRGDVLEVFPAYEEEKALRIEFWGDEVLSISEIDPLRGVVLNRLQKVAIMPASHYVITDDIRERAIKSIAKELKSQIKHFEENNKLLESQRLNSRTMYDLEMISQVGYCNGIENYSRHLTGRKRGEAPPTLLDFFPDEWLLFIDESHASVPQVGGMFRGDRSRKQTLVDFGFRLPSALDNRPLKFEEFENRIDKVVFVSATPADYELEKTHGVFVEQVIRPTGLIDPDIEIRPAGNQVDDLLEEIRLRVEKKQRVLVTTLTKKMSEELADYYADLKVKVKYLHSDIDTMERMRIIRDLRLGEFDVLVGINLLREGLDIPEVSLVAILDADKEGFLRSERSLIQTMGRAARNVEGRVILYADKITGSMERAISETDRRRTKQKAYNKKNNITPKSIKKAVSTHAIYGDGDYVSPSELNKKVSNKKMGDKELGREIDKLTKEMFKFAEQLKFEKAASIRDRIKSLKKQRLLES